MTEINPSGGVRVFFEIMNELHRRGHSVTLTTHRASLPFSLLGKLNRVKGGMFVSSESFGSRAITILGQSKLEALQQLTMEHRIRRFVQAMPECDVNIAHNDIAACAAYRSRKGETLHHMQHLEELTWGGGFRSGFCRRVMQLPMHRVVNSVWLRDRLLEKYGYNPPIVHPAIDHRVFHDNGSQRERGTRLRVLSYGKAVAWKGLREGLEAIRIARKSRDIEYVVYGSSDIPNQVQTDVQFRFVRLPSDIELAELYRSSDVVVCPSWYESFPLPPLEAMACGTPVVTTRPGTEDYAVNLENAIVVPPKDPRAIAEGINMIASDLSLSERLRGHGIRTAKQFSWSNTVDQLEGVLKELVKRDDPNMIA